ncbi:hypothetical protein J3A83DRAFT_4372222 [Scleroderma citrinum]
MGNVQSLTRSTGALDSFVADLGGDIIYDKSIAQCRFLKTVKCRHRNGYLVVKIFIKHDPGLSLRPYIRKQKVDREALLDIPNVYNYQAFVETDKAGFLIRHTRPFLSSIEKKWIVFQLLSALSLAHAQKTPHGDIKSTNILVTSSNWIYLTDFAPYKPTRLPLDDPSDFSFFFDTTGRRTCYIAPERFYKTNESRSSGGATEEPVTEAMDIFSAGCVIAEMFLEGAPLFTLSQLFKYREEEYSVDGQLAAIEDEGIRSMVKQMISLDPGKRQSFGYILVGARGDVLPECFYSCLHEYIASIGERPLVLSHSSPPPPPHSSTSSSTLGLSPASTVKPGNVTGTGEALPSDSDYRIARIWEDFSNIEPFLIENDVERTIMDIRVDYHTTSSTSPNTHQEIFPVSLHIPSHTPTSRRTPAEDGPALILLSLLLANIRNCALPSSRIHALDVLLALSAHLIDESKLDRAVPYVVELLRDEATIVRAAAVRTLMQILMKVMVITPSNASIFPEYIIPNVRYLVQDQEVFVRATYAQCIAPLAETALRYLEMGQALKTHGVAPGLNNNDKRDHDELHFEVSYDTSLYDLHLSIQEQLSALLMDPSPVVKRAVLHNISALCIFLGRQKTNDVVLSHMITYLNDRDWLLRHAFFESIVDVAACAGGRSLEEYILPLMVQALSDVEESVVARVLSALTSLCELGLFQKMRIWELLSATLSFLYHPNVWIRQGAAAFVASAAIRLQPSDVWCILYPSLRHMLRSDVKEIDEQSLLGTMKQPLPRPVFDGAVQWATQAERTTFWKVDRKPMSRVESLRESMVATRKGSTSSVVPARKWTEEDDAHLQKLQNLGMTQPDEAKLQAMRDCILKVATNISNFAPRPRTEPEHTKIMHTIGIVELQKLSVVPQTIFLKARTAPSENVRASQVLSRKTTDLLARLSTSRTSFGGTADQGPAAFEELRKKLANLNQSVTSLNAVAVARDKNTVSPAPVPSTSQPTSLAPPNPPTSHDRPSSPTDSIVSATNSSAVRIPLRLHVGSTDAQKAAPAVGSSNTNAVGVLEAPRLRADVSPEISGRTTPVSAMRHSHRTPMVSHGRCADGHEQSISNLLENFYSDNSRELQSDFGPKVHDGAIRRRSAARQSFISRDSSSTRRIEATLIMHLQCHSDCVTGFAVSPDHVFFVSCSDDMTVKVWDTARLERSVTSKPRHTYAQHHARVKCVCMLEAVHCFASAAEDGSLHVVRVHISQTGPLPKYGKVQAIREHRVDAPGEYITCMHHYNTEAASNLVYATTHSVITTLDLRTMRVLQRLENPRHFGSITCMCLDRKRTWVLVGTSSGVLSLWDKRFGLLLKSWRVGKSTPGKMSKVHQCAIHPTRGKGRWVMAAVETWKAGSEPSPLTLIEVWDIEKTVLVESYVTRTTTSASEPVPEPEQQTGTDAEPNAAEAITALVNSRYPGGTAYVNFSKRNRESSQSVQREDPLPAPSPDIRSMVVGLDFGGHSAIHRSEIVDLSSDAPVSNRSRGFIVSGSEDRRIRLWDLTKIERTVVLVSPEAEYDKPVYSTVRSSNETVTSNVETWVQTPTSSTMNNRAAQRMSMIMHNQQNLLRSHHDIITALACIDSPFRGGIISGDRAGAIKVWRVGPGE